MPQYSTPSRTRTVFIAAVLTAVPVGAYTWARVTLGGEAVRTAVAARASAALGQPVAVGWIRPRLLPRPAISLGDVQVGSPARIVVTRVEVGASLLALFSRRVEHASIRADGVRVDLPLPPLTFRALLNAGAHSKSSRSTRSSLPTSRWPAGSARSRGTSTWFPPAAA